MYWFFTADIDREGFTKSTWVLAWTMLSFQLDHPTCGPCQETVTWARVDLPCTVCSQWSNTESTLYDQEADFPERPLWWKSAPGVDSSEVKWTASISRLWARICGVDCLEVLVLWWSNIPQHINFYLWERHKMYREEEKGFRSAEQWSGVSGCILGAHRFRFPLIAYLHRESKPGSSIQTLKYAISIPCLFRYSSTDSSSSTSGSCFPVSSSSSPGKLASANAKEGTAVDTHLEYTCASLQSV